MAIATNNYEIASHFTVMGDEYNFLQAFAGQPSITIEELQDMPESLRLQRENDFYSWLQTIYGEDIRPYIEQGFEARRLNTTDCYVRNFFLVTVQAVLGTASVFEGRTSYYYTQGANVAVNSTPDNEASEFDGWYDITDPNNVVKVLSNRNDVYNNLQKDVILEARYKAVTVYTVVVVNLDDHGSALGGGQVAADDVVYIFSANYSPANYSFAGWFVKGTDTLVASTPSAYYAPKPEHVGSDGKITLESRYNVIPVYVQAKFLFSRTSGSDTYYSYTVALSRRIGCLVNATIVARDASNNIIASIELIVLADRTQSEGALNFLIPTGTVYSVGIESYSPSSCDGFPILT